MFLRSVFTSYFLVLMQIGLLDSHFALRYPRFERLGGSDAAETCEPRQVREEAAVSKNFRVPSGCLPGRFFRTPAKFWVVSLAEVLNAQSSIARRHLNGIG